MPKTAGVVLTMQPPRQPMGWQIEYEIHYGKTEEHKHKEVKLSVTLQDSIHWFCREKKFRVVSVNPDDASKAAGAPAQLFYRRFPEDNIDEYSYHVNSGPARSKIGVDQFYKPIFEFEDKTTLDPHIKTNP